MSSLLIFKIEVHVALPKSNTVGYTATFKDLQADIAVSYRICI